MPRQDHLEGTVDSDMLSVDASPYLDNDDARRIGLFQAPEHYPSACNWSEESNRPKQYPPELENECCSSEMGQGRYSTERGVGTHAMAFNLYPAANATTLAAFFNITLDCMETLNTTLPECESTLFHMALNVDNYWWEEDDVTALCSGNCSTAAKYWDLQVASACDGQYYPSYGKLLPWDTVTGQYIDGLNTACLPSTTNDTWCLIESQEWQGVIPYSVDCSEEPDDPSGAINGTYLESPYSRLRTSMRTIFAYSDYLVDQLQDIGDVCSTSIPDITVRAIPTYSSIPKSVSTKPTTTDATPTSTATSVPTCYGQQVSGSGCDNLSAQYNVTTGDLKAYSQSDSCSFSRLACLPKGCDLYKVTSGDSCPSIIAGAAGNVTLTQFLKWNINILGLCDAPTVGQYVCVGAPGGNYILAPPPLGDDGDLGNGQRGGGGDDGSSETTSSPTDETSTTPPTSSPTVTKTTSASRTTATAPGETQAGIDPDCNKFAKAPKDGSCEGFAADNGISPSQLYAWNNVLGENGASCGTSFWANEYYCVGVPGSSTVSTVTAPGPTQTGIVGNCNKYATPADDKGCEDFAKNNSITPAQLYKWNTVLGANGSNCGNSFWFKEYYCVGVSS
ncbi:hypothetical protein N7532_005775 [Penicillium argentinense]|uniref:LysM domain-containing protein n=1 Tax=Penicillium argentinense TaxID=1131581 RepID=A0A9W9KA53_9EURO|nr:uncharacterized protein N7532_005775 [Penicillium argentinense]KAJ5098774.1 hypothetical protein N7532_005775 [Penicillium argentinense]